MMNTEIGLCMAIESRPDNFIGLLRANQDSPEDLLPVLDNIESGKYDRICGQPVVPGSDVCEGHTNW